MNLVIASVQSLRDLWDSEILGTKESIRESFTFLWHHFDRKGSHLCALLALRPGHVFRGENLQPNILSNTSGVSPRSFAAVLQVSSQMLKQFGYGETNAVMVRGFCKTTQRAVEKTGLFGSDLEWDMVLVMCFFKKMQYCQCQALSCCRQLCRSHWCCSCCGAGKCLHGCECVWQSEVGMQVNSEFPWVPSLWPGWWVQQSSCWVCWWQCYLVTPGDNKK